MRALIGLIGMALATGCLAAEQRLVVIGHQLTEIVFALDAGDTVVGVHGYVDHIPGAAELPRLRGPRQTSAESVLAFRPTDVWIMDGRATPEMAHQLQAVGINVQFFRANGACWKSPHALPKWPKRSHARTPRRH
ncbi:hypothetical protein [Alkalilimnicola ehrlichii]|uniref:Fe/B12 periplasmic-binding domain-containing protein n=1 Tax=Alkalilimnicola ehrlichii TaxID=351052 RepID=A0A3E0WRL4_9GAMM|nr:hypothetical protein [Alkalilimnicola ehrlichii]RFA34626.1 hypothetical protein CAL65_14785 [Alkalilimnicola ehrlichii]